MPMGGVPTPIVSSAATNRPIQTARSRSGVARVSRPVGAVRSAAVARPRSPLGDRHERRAGRSRASRMPAASSRQRWSSSGSSPHQGREGGHPLVAPAMQQLRALRRGADDGQAGRPSRTESAPRARPPPSRSRGASWRARVTSSASASWPSVRGPPKTSTHSAESRVLLEPQRGILTVEPAQEVDRGAVEAHRDGGGIDGRAGRPPRLARPRRSRPRVPHGHGGRGRPCPWTSPSCPCLVSSLLVRTISRRGVGAGHAASGVGGAGGG